MRTLFYIIIPIAIFSVIFANALFGHLIFASDSSQTTVKYSVYVHLLSDWNSDSKNIIFDVTNSWHSPGGHDRDLVFDAESKEYNANRLQEIQGRPYVELKHEFSDCKEEWQPVLYRKAADALHHGIEYILGAQLSADPAVSVYPDIGNANYDILEQQSKIKAGYAQFFPACTSQNHTSYDYSIRTDNKDIGFDVYFVPSSAQADAFSSEDFEYYLEPGCYGQNKQSYSGTCSSIQKNGGLLVILPDELRQSTTKVTVNMYEKEQ